MMKTMDDTELHDLIQEAEAIGIHFDEFVARLRAVHDELAELINNNQPGQEK